MYSHIINPKTGRLVKINSKLGEELLQQYIKQIGGARTALQSVSPGTKVLTIPSKKTEEKKKEEETDWVKKRSKKGSLQVRPSSKKHSPKAVREARLTALVNKQSDHKNPTTKAEWVEHMKKYHSKPLIPNKPKIIEDWRDVMKSDTKLQQLLTKKTLTLSELKLLYHNQLIQEFNSKYYATPMVVSEYDLIRSRLSKPVFMELVHKLKTLDISGTDTNSYLIEYINLLQTISEDELYETYDDIIHNAKDHKDLMWIINFITYFLLYNSPFTTMDQTGGAVLKDTTSSILSCFDARMPDSGWVWNTIKLGTVWAAIKAVEYTTGYDVSLGYEVAIPLVVTAVGATNIVAQCSRIIPIKDEYSRKLQRIKDTVHGDKLIKKVGELVEEVEVWGRQKELELWAKKNPSQPIEEIPYVSPDALKLQFQQLQEKEGFPPPLGAGASRPRVYLTREMCEHTWECPVCLSDFKYNPDVGYIHEEDENKQAILNIFPSPFIIDLIDEDYSFDTNDQGFWCNRCVWDSWGEENIPTLANICKLELTEIINEEVEWVDGGGFPKEIKRDNPHICRLIQQTRYFKDSNDTSPYLNYFKTNCDAWEEIKTIVDADTNISAEQKDGETKNRLKIVECPNPKCERRDNGHFYRGFAGEKNMDLLFLHCSACGMNFNGCTHWTEMKGIRPDIDDTNADTNKQQRKFGKAPPYILRTPEELDFLRGKGPAFGLKEGLQKCEGDVCNFITNIDQWNKGPPGKQLSEKEGINKIQEYWTSKQVEWNTKYNFSVCPNPQCKAAHLDKTACNLLKCGRTDSRMLGCGRAFCALCNMTIGDRGYGHFQNDWYPADVMGSQCENIVFAQPKAGFIDKTKLWQARRQFISDNCKSIRGTKCQPIDTADPYILNGKEKNEIMMSVQWNPDYEAPGSRGGQAYRDGDPPDPTKLAERDIAALKAGEEVHLGERVIKRGMLEEVDDQQAEAAVQSDGVCGKRYQKCCRHPMAPCDDPLECIEGICVTNDEAATQLAVEADGAQLVVEAVVQEAAQPRGRIRGIARLPADQAAQRRLVLGMVGFRGPDREVDAAWRLFAEPAAQGAAQRRLGRGAAGFQGPYEGGEAAWEEVARLERLRDDRRQREEREAAAQRRRRVRRGEAWGQPAHEGVNRLGRVAGEWRREHDGYDSDDDL